MPAVAIVGSGGVGGWLGAKLQRYSGTDVLFVGRSGSEHTLALQAGGLQYNGADESFALPGVRCVGADELASADFLADYVLVCTKTWQLEAALASIPHLLRPDGLTVVCAMQNGVEAHERISSACGGDCRVIAAVARVAAFIESPGVVVKSAAFTGGSLEIGNPFAVVAGSTDRQVESLCALLSQSGVVANPSDDILAALWTKLVSMGSFGPVGALVRAPIDVMIETPQTLELVKAAMAEIVAVGLAKGVNIDPQFPATYLESAASSPAGTTVSTIRDVMNGKPSEVMELSGAVVRHGSDVGVATPIHSFLVRSHSLSSCQFQTTTIDALRCHCLPVET